jgi:hypothetical protein
MMIINDREIREDVRKGCFSSIFDLDNEGFSDKEYVKGFSRRNLLEIERIIQKQMRVFGERLGGKYVPPSDKEIEEKFDKTLKINPFVFPNVDEEGRVWALNKLSLDRSMDNCAAFNNSGLHGFIVFPKSNSVETESLVRLYRGARIKIGRDNVAPLARIDGVEVADLENYLAGKVKLDEILEKWLILI